MGEHLFDALAQTVFAGVHYQLRVVWYLIWVANACEVLDYAGSGFGI